MKSIFSGIRLLEAEEKFLLFNTFFFLSFIIYLVALFLLDGHSEKNERNIYLLYFSVGPFLSFIFYRMGYNNKKYGILIEKVLYCFYGYLLIAFAVSLYLVSHRIYAIYLFCIFHFIGTLCLFKIHQLYPSAIESKIRLINTYNNILSLIFPSAFIGLSVLFNSSVRKYLIEKISESTAFQAGILGGFIITFIIFVAPWKFKGFNITKIFCHR
jgi:hypothetical protein